MAAATASAHGGAGDHAHDAPDLSMPTLTAGGIPSVSGHGNHFDLTIAFPLVHEGESVPLDLFLADWHTNAPVSGAEIELTMTGSEYRTVLPVEATEDPGRYQAVVDRVGAETYSFLADVNHGDAIDLISMSGFRAAGSEAHDEGEERMPFALADYLLYILAGVSIAAGLIGFSIGVSVRGKRSATGSSQKAEETP